MMLSRVRQLGARVALPRLVYPTIQCIRGLETGRTFASLATSDSNNPAAAAAAAAAFVDDEQFIPHPPDQLTVEMAEGIGDMTQFFLRHGISQQRLQALSRSNDLSVVHKWQKMMEIFLTTQVQVIAGLGYGADEQGLLKYAQDLAKCIQAADEDVAEEFTHVRRATWRELVATAFALELDDLPALSIVDARNLMHKVSSKMIEPSVLLEIQTKTAKLQNDDEDKEQEVAAKHQILQDILVNSVYLGGSPTLVEESGFGSGPQGYAKLQCAMSDHEGDPLIAQYATSAMTRVWSAAGLDMDSVQGGGGGAGLTAPVSP